MPMCRRLATTSIALISAIANLRAETVVFTPVADTCLFEWTADFNFGAQDDLPAGGLGGQAGSDRLARSLFRFDLTSIPPGAAVTAARMTLRVTRQPTFESASAFALNRILIPWTEGNKSGERPGGATATAGEPTWNNRQHPATPWAAPGGQFGTDYATQASATHPNVDGIGTYLFDFTPHGVSELVDMIAGPSGNHGWVLWSLSEGSRRTAHRWASREATTEPVPHLEITWSPPIAHITSAAPSLDGSAFLIDFHAIPGFSYQIETLNPSGIWVPGETRTPATEGPQTFSLPASEPASIMRIATRVAP